jgi:hypothetical protein
MNENNRPLGVTVTAIAYGIAAFIVWGRLIRGETNNLPLSLFSGVGISSIMVGLWRVKAWGRVLTVVWSAAAILYGIYTTPHALAAMAKGTTYPMAISLGRTVLHGAALVYLVQPKVAAAFRRPPSLSIGINPKNPV